MKVLITGASSGIGLDMAKYLAQKNTGSFAPDKSISGDTKPSPVISPVHSLGDDIR